MKTLVHTICSLSLALLSATHCKSQVANVLRFDAGSGTSPVENGYQRITHESKYDKRTGFGWLGDAAARRSFHRTAISEHVNWNHKPPATVVDGVAGKRDLVFRIDLPNGQYAVEILVGDPGGFVPAGMGRFLDTGVRGSPSGGPGGPLFSMAVSSGKRLVAKDVAARTYPHRGRAAPASLLRDLGLPFTEQTPYVRLGNVARLRFVETVRDGKLLLQFHGDDATYRAAVTRLKGASAANRRKWIHQAGGPFTHNSVLAVTVRPYVEPAFALEKGRLKLTGKPSPPLQRIVDRFNGRDFARLEKAIEALPSRTFAERHTRLLAWTWLAGHPDYYNERKIVPGIRKEIDAARNQAGLAERAELDSLRAALLDFERGMMSFDQRTRDGQQVVTCMNRAEGYFQRAQAGQALYWKSQLYRARIWYGMDPNRRAELWPKAEAVLRELAKVFPGNRWVRFYLHSDASGWRVNDYRKSGKEAPEWAVELHNYYNHVLDLCDWWIANRQQPDNGALGGEWGDDVEFLPLIAWTGFICPDAAPSLLTGTRRFCDGLWEQSGIVSKHNGFFHLTSDAEHSAEFTGNVLGMMLHVSPGDPVYVERALKTGKLMRDLWTGRNDKGLRLFRSSYLGAYHVPRTKDSVDSAICGRAIIPALHVLEHNRNPEIARLVVEYAGALLELADSTAKGKPRGVLPGPVVYATGELGHPGSKEWWLAPPGTFQQTFSFPRYHGFRRRILTTAWKLTGEAKYLSPIEAEAKLARRFANVDLARAKPGGNEWTGQQLARTEVRQLWQQIEAEKTAKDPTSVGLLLDPKHVAGEAKQLAELARQRWPMMTDDAVMTDRVAFRGCVNSTVWYCGAKVLAQQIEPAVSYAGAGRDFAALVLRHNPRYVKLQYYGFHDKQRTVALRFWELERGAEYRLNLTCPGKGDQALTKEFMLREPGAGAELNLKNGQTYVIEVTQIRPGKRKRRIADPAVSARDVRYDPRGHLLVDVHNLGNAPAQDVTVDFYDGDPARGGKRLGRTLVANVEPPNALQPQLVRTGVEWKPSRARHQIHVVLDADNRIEELAESNNRAQAVIVRNK